MTDETDKTAEAPAADTTAAQVVDEPKKVDPDTDPAPADAKDDGGKEPVKGDDDAEGDAEDGEPKRKKPSGSQRAKRREQYLLEENRALAERLERLERQSTKDGGEPKEGPPKEEDFNGDWVKYTAAMAAYEAGQAVEKKLSAREQSEGERRRAELVRERDIAHLERIDEAREVITDFDQVMATQKGVNVRDEVIEEIKSSEKSALLAYHLAKNPEKLRELNSMTGRELAREIGRLEGSVRMPAGKKVTTAPPLLTALKGGAAPQVDLAQVDDMNEFASRLMKDLEKRRAR